MKRKQTLPELSRAEFDILKVLWKSNEQSVREVHDQLIATHNWAYSTTKTMMDRMVKKGLLDRKNFHGIFIYKPLISRPKGFARFIQFFTERVLEMDYDSVVSLFVKSDALTPDEVEELSRLLDQEQQKES